MKITSFFIGFLLFGLSNNCIGQTIEDFPWLANVIDQENCCFNQDVQLLNITGFQFIYVANDSECAGEGGTLYLGDGTVWCESSPIFDCLSFYNPSSSTSLYNCSSAGDYDIFGAYSWLSPLGLTEDCSSEMINVYQGEGPHQYVYVAQDNTETLYYEDGTYLCTTLENYDCPSLYGFEETDIIADWTCGDGGPVDPEIALPNFVAYNTGMIPLFPEGIEFDYEREAFVVSSAATGMISLVGLDGTYSPLVPPTTFAGNGTFGLQIDAPTDRILAVSSNIQNPMVANLYIFQLSTGALLHNVDLSTFSPGLNFVNDVTVDAEGNAYVSNSDQGIVFKVDVNGNASIFFQDANFTPADPSTETGFNGIEFHEDGYLLISHYETNKIYKLDISNPSQLSEVALPEGFIRGGDGMYLDGNELVVVNNGAVPFVSKFVTNDGWNSGTVSGDTYATGDIFPTTVIKVGDDYMINNSYFNFPAYGVTPTDYLISKASFDFSERFSGTSTEIPRINTPVLPLLYPENYPAPFYAECSTPIGADLPDLRGDWEEQTVTIGGIIYPAQENIHHERIEQCGNRILIVSEGVLHEVFLDDDSMYNGVNDINPTGQQIHSSGRFENNTLILTPIFPPETGIMLPDVTRELIQDDNGNDVLKFFNPLLGSTRYCLKE